MKYDIFFKLAKEKGIEECELKIRKSYTLSFTLFHSEVENYECDEGYSISARGKINGKVGSAFCDVWNKEKASFLVNEIINNANVIEDDDPIIIYKGSPKYKKVNTYNKELKNIPAKDKLNKLFELEKLINQDKRITEGTQVEYSEGDTTSIMLNSHGLKLTSKNNSYCYTGYAVAKKGDQVKSASAFFLENDFSKANMENLAKEIIKNVTDQLGGEPCDTGNYPVVLSNEVVSNLVGAYISSASAEEVQKKTSLFIGKLNSKVASSKITIEDRPLAKTLFARGFDSEGVATYNKPIIKNGKLLTYLYNLTTAAKDKVESTGNGYGSAAKIGIDTTFIYVKPGKSSLEDLFVKVGNGVYITEVSGLNAGLDALTGNFSLQSTGFLIKDGKIDRPLDIITVSGNLVKMFKDVVEVGSNEKVFASAVSTPSLLIKSMSIGGK